MTIKLLTSTVAILSLAAASAFATDSNFERTLSAGSSTNVSISTGSGYIRLHPGSGDQVHIVGHVHSNHGWMSGGGDADSRAEAAQRRDLCGEHLAVDAEETEQVVA